MIGADTELDRVILESLSEPLVHLLRNAVGHGIESPTERERAKKPPRGRVELRAEQRGSLGRDRRLRRRARRLAGNARGGAPRRLARRRARAPRLLDRGRGDRALRPRRRPRRRQAHVESFGGTLEVRSEPGKGTEIVLLLPLALALLEVLLFERGGHVFGLPLAAVEEALTVGDTFTLEGRRSLELRGRSVPARRSRRPRRRSGPRPLPPVRPRSSSPAAAGAIAAVCDRLLGEEEVVVKPLGPLLARRRGLSRRGDPRRRPHRAAARPGLADERRRAPAAPTAPPPARASRARAQGPRRRGLVHRARAAAQHPRGRRLPRRDRPRRPRRA